ncbi:MAG: Phospho-N-acetylmuramoyl-pentapeptide-transferase [Candidatus Nomurabacteria bacterium]|nr:Phospho-N-acetylmuramoyl-pentapeptide-transferase [Candidatus Nomurabacteria bacterium]
MISLTIFKVLMPAVLSFIIGILFSPPLISFLRKHKIWKKKNVGKSIDGSLISITATLHNDEERKLLRMGGIVIWFSVFATTAIFLLISWIFPSSITEKIEFISRNQTWLPLIAMLVGAIVGGVDDLLVAEAFGGSLNSYVGGGLSFPVRLVAVSLLGLGMGAWFYYKLDVSAVYIPFHGGVVVGGLLFILFFTLVTVALFSTSVIDGVDGLSGGIFSAIFTAYGFIAYYQQQIDIAALCFVIVGAIFAFLWFNVPPATYMMAETGIMALTLSLSVIAFLTDSVMYLPIIALPLVITTGSVILQLLWKKIFKRKLFIVAPLHHHFEAKGWAKAQVTMRYWIISYMCAMLGVVVALIS